MKRYQIILGVIIAFLLLALLSVAYVNDADALVTIDLPLPKQETTQLWSTDEVMCATRMVYGEARGATTAVQIATAAVAMRRASDGRRYPMDLCAVVRQPGQFTGYADRFEMHTAQDEQSMRNAYFSVQRAMNFTSLPQSYQHNYYFHSGTVPRFSKWAALHGHLDGQTFYGVKA